MSHRAQQQWTEVRYNRRGVSSRSTVSQARPGDRWRAESRGMACAFPVPREGVPVPCFFPNRPVPPLTVSAPVRSSLSSRYVEPQTGSDPGPIKRSYADVVRQFHSRPLQGRTHGPGHQEAVNLQRRHLFTAAFEVATRWARRNLPRVKQEVLDHAEALIMSCGETRGERMGEGESSEGSLQQDDVERTRRPRGRGLSDSQTLFLEEIVQVHSDPVPVVPKQRVPPKQTTKTPPVARDTCTVATMTERRVEDSVKWEGEEIGEGEWDKGSQGARESPKEQRTSRRSQGQIPHPGTHGCRGNGPLGRPARPAVSRLNR
ncbi:hypothetical protein Q7C36_009368 [Tachysurus vachellii]|uniref:Uncharacterized protein n=1 Tax=Tachysurus vachellii TaxID=175792 RepID=A0AA88N509_TACVA|nr:hypothetical protein Q7C36_009363 [Tachysurus vachellii]KAK2847682.1 hypothetical protein Q7C36_009364 [Tachysurus vachellii]KAK2847683.1 hypothetical protein Q7C36_009365 [Tachysurus vachellii]KAK2847685.1 hypothetical protein Q7C36_009367 [Tachysurus vachellii]KAK2847686.1 hypothetical protein Q7C36_009368 [Tachysurus vachellii]